MDNAAKVSSGIEEIDRLLDGFYLGDNVIWYDDAGSLAWVFCQNLVANSQRNKRPLIYVCFDRSPKNLLAKLGPLVNNPYLTIMDCFTWGKGAGSDVFLQFYRETPPDLGCRLVLVENPADPDAFQKVLYDLHGQMTGDVRFVFESLTGMQEVWGGEEQIIKLYSHACPRLYELMTLAYWVMEKKAHSEKLKAQINQIAQVVIDLSIKRGTTSLSILKAENRPDAVLYKPQVYWTRGIEVLLDSQGDGSPLALGAEIKNLRSKRGLSQSELARMIGVTASNISQVESNLIHPSIPALIKIAEILGVEVGYFFRSHYGMGGEVVFSPSEAKEIRLTEVPGDILQAKTLLPPRIGAKAKPYSMTFRPGKRLMSHFMHRTGAELGYVLEGELEFIINGVVQFAQAGDILYFTTEKPTAWNKPGQDDAKIFWLEID
jgi:transcriptional regulator with XRE-family HTH domain/KaiC/GvpD/RAD55 family RecA-like ATPase